MMAVLLVAAAGCAKQGSAVMDVNQVADQAAKTVKFTDQMSAIDQKTVDKIYGLSDADVVKAKAYESTGATAEEVAAFEAKDDAAAKTVMDAVSKRVENQKAGFQDYQPKEMQKLGTPLIEQKGKYIFLCVADDTSPAKQVIDSAAK